MTRDSFDKATVALDHINKLNAIKAKLEREFPEFKYDNQLKEIVNDIFGAIDDRIKVYEDEFKNL